MSWCEQSYPCSMRGKKLSVTRRSTGFPMAKVLWCGPIGLLWVEGFQGICMMYERDHFKCLSSYERGRTEASTSALVSC